MFRVSLRKCNHIIFIKNILKYSSSCNFPTEADVVIIGGGNLGCNLLYQLSLRGVNTVLLERNKITSGTTWHSNGLFWRLRPNDVEIQLLSSLPKFVRKLEEETELSTGFETNGGLFIARTEERLKEYKRLNTIGKYFKIESEIISSVEASKLHPLLDHNSFTAALYSPNDGRVDPSMLCAATVKGATKLGGKVIENCAVVNIDINYTTGFKKIKGLTTDFGRIKTNCVVNAAGVWSRNVAKMVQLDIPLAAFKHSYIITESIPETKGTPNIRDHDASICYKTLGDSLYIGYYEMNPIFLTNVPMDVSFSLYDLDWSILSVQMEKACELTPVLKNTGIKSDVCGPEAFTPDHKPLLGEDPRLGGFYYACGFNSAGMMLGTGCAEQLAIWITKGRPELPMANYDIRRFAPYMINNMAYINEMSHESYATNYNIVFPHNQPLAARNIKLDPFHEVMLQKGAIMEQSQGWEQAGYFLKNDVAPICKYDWYGCYGNTLNEDNTYKHQLQKDLTFEFPESYSLVADEARSARTKVALFNMSQFGKFYLSGPNATEVSSWLFTGKIKQNRAVQCCTLNNQGGIEGYVTVVNLNNSGIIPIKNKGFYIVAEGSTSYRVFYHLQKEIQISGLNTSLIDITEKIGFLLIEGPKSCELLQEVADNPQEIKELSLGETTIVTIAKHPCQIIRLSHIGEMGYELHIPNSSCIPIFNKLLKTGKNFNLRLAGYRAYLSLNCEKGNYIWNSDLTSVDNPIEAGLENICNSSNYLGQKHVEFTKQNGIKKIRVCLELQTRIPLWGLEIIWRNNEIVGFLRRGSYGFCLNKSIGIG
ncbi:hypothetical protein FQA39_LY13564 [Lamprigera yunnana]|nr:hypothetical protein FQA39_LY13564 [Lamprigera yunnana]